MRLIALTDHIIIKLDEIPEKQGTIVVPDVAKESLTERRGTVLSVGLKAEQESFGALMPGVRVRINKYAGLTVDNNDPSLLSIVIADVLAVEGDTAEVVKSGA